MGAQEIENYDVKAGLETIPAFRVAGVSAVISNENDAATGQINALWQTFFEKNIGQALEDARADDVIYAVYSDYQGDHTKPYRLTIGYKIEAEKEIRTPLTASLPENLFDVQVQAGDYALLAAQGPQPGSLIETWEAIWQSDLDRKFETDFEVYGPRFFEDGVHEILVCIGVNI